MMWIASFTLGLAAYPAIFPPVASVVSAQMQPPHPPLLADPANPHPSPPIVLVEPAAQPALLAAHARRILRPTKLRRALQAQLVLEDVASACLDDGCSVDTIKTLLDELQRESQELTKRQQTLLILIGRLQVLMKAPTSKNESKSELKKIVGAAARSFTRLEDGYDFPGEALGYSLPPPKRKVRLD